MDEPSEMSRLLERSSLGTPTSHRLRALTDKSLVSRILADAGVPGDETSQSSVTTQVAASVRAASPKDTVVTCTHVVNDEREATAIEGRTEFPAALYRRAAGLRQLRPVAQRTGADELADASQSVITALDRLDDVPRRSRQKVETRRRLLEAASQVLMERGVADASMEEIADRARVSKATLFFHFGSRMDLLATVAGYLYLLVFPSEATEEPRTDLAAFVRAYLGTQRRPEVRLIWELGDLVARTHPHHLDAAYWNLVGEIELRLLDSGVGPAVAHDRAQVLAPALMHVAQRAARDLTTQAELRDFVDASVRVAMCPPPT